MTVAAVVLAPPPVIELRDEAGQPLVRAVVDAALAGGATPIVVVSPDPSGVLAAALAGSEAHLVKPTSGVEPGIAWFSFGLSQASALVAGTSAALLWPGRYTWVDPETVTSLLEAHGVKPTAILRPTCDGEPGFPALIPAGYAGDLIAMAGIHGPEAIEKLAGFGAPVTAIELGDPGTTADAGTPRAALAPYRGPSEPTSGHVHEWGSALSEGADDLS